MDAQKVDMFLMANAKHFNSREVPQIREVLLEMDDSRWPLLQSINFSDPTTSLIVSIVAGQLGVDRFMIGDTGIGIAKLLTCGGMGIWAIVDWFLIQDAAKEKNLEKLKELMM